MRKVIALLVMVCVPSVLESQKRPSRFTNEAVVFSGMMLKPGSRTTMGAGFGFGIGKSMINFEMVGETLGPAALGFGEFLYPNETGLNRWPVSRSRLFEVGLSYQRDIWNTNGGQITPGGRGYSFTTKNDRIVRVTLGVYVHSRYNGWLKK